ncbi:CBN-FBXA-145 protein [Caenorhabditis brenneri]|uniref:CBN-FBXA-145 protein n=1 Tax=Caenorhabditis brenneri TaxID=135651 RepID=G0NV01_CAEBE|nr:CBN-FBXA-145 protein [Caenorhabditis brenneri]
MGNQPSVSFDKNLLTFEKWNFLPPEIKAECIKRMDFKSRFLLRATSRTERLLVDSQHFNLYHVRLEGVLPYPINSIISSGFDDLKLTILSAAHSQTEMHVIFSRNRERFFETILPLLLFILKKATVEELFLERIRQSDWRQLLGEQFPPESLNVKNFHGVVLTHPETMFFVSKLKNNTRSVHVDANTCQNFPMGALLENRMQWIALDADIGKTFRVTSTTHQTFNQFSAKFKDRIIKENSEEIRIRTDNPSKHILLKLAKRWRVSRPLTCVVISSETEESEFESFGRWVTKKMIPLWEYLSFIFTEEFGDEDDLNFSSFMILLMYCLWLIASMLFTRHVLRR